MRSLLQDLRGALRLFRRSRFATAAAVLSLALAIGANTAIFSVIDALFFRPYAIKQPEQLIWIYNSAKDRRGSQLSYRDYLDLRQEAGAFRDIAAHSRRGGLLDTGGGETELVLVTVVSDNYFDLLGIRPVLGRPFTQQERADEPVVMISYGLWQRRFAADASVVGRTIRLSGRDCRVAGIMPAGFSGLTRVVTNDVWVPTSTWLALNRGNRVELEDRAVRAFECIARLRPGVRLAQAQVQLDTIAARLEREYPASNKESSFQAVSDAEQTRRYALMPSAVLLAVVGLVLLIACANVATILLAQAEARRRETGMRLALGAGRLRLVRQVLTESAALCVVGAALGLLFAFWLLRLVPALLPPAASYIQVDVRLDARVLRFTALVSVLTTLLFGLAPALKAIHVDVLPLLRGEVAGWRRLSVRNALVAGQIALAVLLIACSGLLLRSFWHTRSLRPGFDPNQRILAVSTGAGGGGPAEFYDRVLARIRALPGVLRASYARRLPMAGSGGGATVDVAIPGVLLSEGRQAIPLKFNNVDPQYFATLGTRILRGRRFTAADAANAPKVAIISETMARRFWPDQDPVGRFLRTRGKDWQIAGVAEDAPINSIHEAPEPFLYFPFAQAPSGEATLLVLTTGEPAALADLVKRQVRAEDPYSGVFETTTLERHMRSALYMDWVPAAIAAGLSLIGVLLAAVGLYGVVSYSVARRTREIGIRMALGARGPAVLRLVLRDVCGLALVGVPAGIAGAMAAGRLMSGMLYGISPQDPPALAASAVLVTAVALLAAQVPAWRATRIDPTRVLHEE